MCGVLINDDEVIAIRADQVGQGVLPQKDEVGEITAVRGRFKWETRGVSEGIRDAGLHG